MKENLYRKQSIEKITSPEKLDQYIKICNPPLWFVLSAITLLLIGVIIWGFFGRLDSKLDVATVVENGFASVFVKKKDLNSVIDKKLTLEGKQYLIHTDMVFMEPISVDEKFSEYVRFLGDLQEDEWVYSFIFPVDLRDGVYDSYVTLDSINPISFVIN